MDSFCIYLFILHLHNLQISSFVAQLLWRFLHLAISIFFFVLAKAYAVESYLISSGLLRKYKAIDVEKVRYLAIVVDSQDARRTSKVIRLLKWLAAIGVKRVCLYDAEGENIYPVQSYWCIIVLLSFFNN